MKEEEVNQCQIQEWYPKFKSVSIKALIHRLPESFVNYLLDDSGPFLLLDSVLNEDALPNRIRNSLDEEDYQVSEGSGDESEQPSLPPPSFPELELEIKESIKSLGGAIFPKLNWSAPKDSCWMSTSGTLRCTSFSEIALLLRSSDSLIHDLCHAYDSCTDRTSSRPQTFFLALRKWHPSLRPDMEFRCFVKGRNLVGVCQREVTAFYPALLEKKDDLGALISEFFMEYARDRFESQDYTFDVYVTRDERVKIVDFNPWGAFTLPLLFSWEELEKIESKEGDGVEMEMEMEMRTVESQCGVRPGLKTAVPYDYLDTSPGSGWDQFLRNCEGELRKQSLSDSPQAVHEEVMQWLMTLTDHLKFFITVKRLKLFSAPGRNGVFNQKKMEMVGGVLSNLGISRLLLMSLLFMSQIGYLFFQGFLNSLLNKIYSLVVVLYFYFEAVSVSNITLSLA